VNGLRKLVVTLGTLTYAVGVPILEVNDTHVFNPDWTPHVRIHEVWQLLTNSALGVFALWLVWGRGNLRLASGLGLAITGGFLSAFALKDLYGGSLKYLDGSEKTVLGINIGLLGFGVVFVLFLAVFVTSFGGKEPGEKR